MSSLRVYVCFDPRNDADLFERLALDSRRADSPFEIVGATGLYVESQSWEDSFRSGLDGVDEVVVICSEHSDTADAVNAELRIVRAHAKPYFLLLGRRDVPCTKPAAARATDCYYAWIWDILKFQVGVTLRRAALRGAEAIG